MSTVPPYPAPIVFPEPPPSYDEAMGLLPADSSRSQHGSMHDILHSASVPGSRHGTPQRQLAANPLCPYPLTAAEMVPRPLDPHIIRPYPMGGGGAAGGSGGSHSVHSIAETRMVVDQQPGLEGNGVAWVSKPPAEDTCPTGLEYLLDLDCVYVCREKKNFLGKRRSFSVRNNYNKMIYLVVETGRVRCQAVDHYERPAFCYLEDTDESEDRMELIEGFQAAFFERCSGCVTDLQKVMDGDRTMVLYVDSNCCGDDSSRMILSPSQSTIGSIEHSALGDMYRRPYKIRFPRDLDVRMKAALICMCMRLEISCERDRGEYP